MKHFTALFFLLIWGVTVSSLSALDSKDTISTRRLLSKHTEYVEFVDGGSYTTTKNWDYVYQPANPDLIGYVNLHDWQEHWWGSEGWHEMIYDDSYTFDYVGTINQSEGMLQYDYLGADDAHYQYIRDEQYQLIRESKILSPTLNVNIERYRGQEGRLERLRYGDDSAIFEDYQLHYTNSQSLPSSVSGTRNLTLDFGTTPAQQPFILHPLEVFIIDSYFNRLNLLLNMAIAHPTYQLQSYTDQVSGLTFHLTWGNVNGEYGYAIAETGENVRFDPSGYLIRYTYSNTSSAPEFYSHLTLGWETVVHTEDNVAQPADLSITAFPNPFSSELQITIGSKADYPKDIYVYNVKGQLIRQWESSKSDMLIWDGKDAAGSSVSNGIYLIKAKQGNRILTAKVIRVD